MSDVTDLDLDARRRRIRYRAWHRGLRELELLLGRFVEDGAQTLDAADIAAFEALLDVDDQTVLGWLMGRYLARRRRTTRPCCDGCGPQLQA